MGDSGLSGRGSAPDEPRLRGAGLSAWLGLFVRGLAMGVVEVIPGVSGGTIAFVTGIYRELVASLASFSPKTLVWCATDPKRFWRHHNLSFLVCLGVGMAISLLLFARLVRHWLEVAPVLVWAFFFGLILYSAFEIGRARRLSGLISFGLAGLLCGLLVAAIDPFAGEPGLSAFFFGGALAVGAWLLPAVSGSFVLLLLGLYVGVLDAVATFDWPVLAALGCGSLAGLAIFPRLFDALLRRRFEPAMSFLTGLMIGSLAQLWPWRQEGALLSPANWSLATGAPAEAPLAVLMMLAGAGCLWLLTLLRPDAERRQAPSG